MERKRTVETARAVRTRPWISAENEEVTGDSSSDLAACAAVAAVAVAVAVKRRRAIRRLAGKLKSLGVISIGGFNAGENRNASVYIR